MWTKYKEEIFRFRTINIMLGFILSAFLIIIFFNSIFSSRELFYSGLELMVLVVGLTFTVSYIGSSSNPSFIKQLRLSGQLVSFLLTSFAIIFTFSFAMIVIYFFTFVILESIGILSINNFLNDDYIYGDAIPTSINWFSGDNNIPYIFKSIVIETILIILFSTILAIFIRNKIFLNGIIVVILVYSVFFGNLFMFNSAFDFSMILNEEQYKFIVGPGMGLKIYINAFLLPWNQIGLFARESLWIGNIDLFDFNDYSYLGFWSILKWLPYVYIAAFSTVIILQFDRLST